MLAGSWAGVTSAEQTLSYIGACGNAAPLPEHLGLSPQNLLVGLLLKPQLPPPQLLAPELPLPELPPPELPPPELLRAELLLQPHPALLAEAQVSSKTEASAGGASMGALAGLVISVSIQPCDARVQNGAPGLRDTQLVQQLEPETPRESPTTF